jgi:LacI family transcriptional regulator
MNAEVQRGEETVEEPSHRRPPSISDVARSAGVSVATVSRVLRDHPDVRSATRRLVQQAVEDLHYRPSSLARALVTGRSRMLALLVSDIANPFYPQLARCIEREAAASGYTLVICSTDDIPSESLRYLNRLMAYGLDGIIHASVGEDEAALLQAAPDLPIVFTNRRPASRNVNFVVSDNRRGARLLTNHLLELGHRHIGFIAGPAHASNANDRLLGFTQAMKGVSDARPAVFHGGFDPSSGRQAVSEWIGSNDRPTAIIGVNDSITIGALEGLIEARLRVPEDVSIAGFDDVWLASSPIVGLTTVAQDIDELGRRSTQVLLQALESPRALPIRQVLRSSLQIRKTTGPVSPKHRK